MKKIIIILVTFIVGFGVGKIPLIKVKDKLIMSKLREITVIDGDTVYTIHNKKIEKIRLIGIDCHETSYNRRADFQRELYKLSLEEIYQKGEIEKEYLQNLLEKYSGNIFIKRQGIDKYGRTLGILFIDKKININSMMLENNICPPFVISGNYPN